MKRSKGMQLGAMLAAILLIAIAFAGTAAPNKEFKDFPKDLPERVLLGLNDSELQDKEIPDFGPEVFDKIKKEPKVRETRGIIPKFKVENERQDWLNKLDELRIGVRNDMHPYLYPKGPVIMYGYNYEGYFKIVFYENITVEASIVDGIYAVVDRQAKKMSIQEVPVVFKIETLPQETASWDSKYRPIVGGIQVQNSTGAIATLGFSVRDTNSNNGYVVSKHLVPQVGMQVWQPTMISGNEAGTVSRLGSDTADAAFIPYSNVEASIHIGSGVLVPVKGDYDPQLGWRVYKSGRTTGITGGYITDVSEVVNSGGIIYYDQVLADYLAQGGDSGSPIWYLDANSDRKIVGINVGTIGSYGSPSYSAYFSKVSAVKNSLSVTVLTR